MILVMRFQCRRKVVRSWSKKFTSEVQDAHPFLEADRCNLTNCVSRVRKRVFELPSVAEYLITTFISSKQLAVK